jgi:hypothetical protein
MGAMARTAGGGRVGMSTGLPRGLPGGGPTGLGANAGGVLDMLTPMLDRDRDGSVVDDVAGMLGKFLGGR